MSTRTRYHDRQAPCACALVLGVLALAAAGAVFAAAADKPAGEGARAAEGALLRCWQDGRLIVEAANLDVPADDSNYVLRMQVREKERPTLVLVDAGRTTCLIRSPGAAGRR